MKKKSSKCGYVGGDLHSANYIPLSTESSWWLLGIWGYFARAAQNPQRHIMKAGQTKSILSQELR